MSATETQTNPVVAIVMGSKSDYEVMKESAKVLSDFKVPLPDGSAGDSVFLSMRKAAWHFATARS